MLGLVAIFVVAFLTRLTITHQLEGLPMWDNPQMDARENLDWARSIASGEFQWPSPPTHGPGYPYFLAGLLALSPDSLAAVRALQAALGSLTAVIVAILGARLASRQAGLAAGFLLALYGPLAFADVALWEEVLILFLLTSSLWILVAHPTLIGGSTAGLLLGLATISRPTMLLFVACAATVLLALGMGRNRWLSAGALLVVSGLVIAPAVAASSRAAGHFVFIRTYGAINFWLGNDPASGGVQNARPNGPWDELVAEPYRNGVAPGGEERYFTRKTVARAAADPLGLAQVLASKAVTLLQAEEPRDNHSLSFFRERSFLLKILPGFGFLLALAVAGVAFRTGARPFFGMPFAYLGCALLPALVALVGLRYRMPAVPLLALVAGAGAASLLDHLRSGDFRALLLPGLTATAFWGFSHSRTHPPSHVFTEEQVLCGNALLEAGRTREATEWFQRAARTDPQAALPQEFLGVVRLREGRPAQARGFLRTSLTLDPRSRSANYYLGLASKSLGDEEGALQAFRKGLDISPRFFPAWLEVGRILLRKGDSAGAAKAFAEAGKTCAPVPEQLLDVAEGLRAAGQPAMGVALARRATRLSPSDAGAWLVLGSIAAESGDISSLRDAVEKASTLVDSSHPPLVLLSAKRQELEGNSAGAFETLKQLVKTNPTSKIAERALLDLARNLGREAEAEAILTGAPVLR
jgi:tetratricopeptide (TPR) repeat protein